MKHYKGVIALCDYNRRSSTFSSLTTYTTYRLVTYTCHYVTWLRKLNKRYFWIIDFCSQFSPYLDTLMYFSPTLQRMSELRRIIEKAETRVPLR